MFGTEHGQLPPVVVCRVEPHIIVLAVAVQVGHDDPAANVVGRRRIRRIGPTGDLTLWSPQGRVRCVARAEAQGHGAKVGVPVEAVGAIVVVKATHGASDLLGRLNQAPVTGCDKAVEHTSAIFWQPESEGCSPSRISELERAEYMSTRGRFLLNRTISFTTCSTWPLYVTARASVLGS